MPSKESTSCNIAMLYLYRDHIEDIEFKYYKKM